MFHTFYCTEIKGLKVNSDDLHFKTIVESFFFKLCFKLCCLSARLGKKEEVVMWGCNPALAVQCTFIVDLGSSKIFQNYHDSLG